MKNPRHKQKNMKRKYIIADGESGYFDTLRAAKMHLSFYSDKEYKQFIGSFIVGYKKNGDEIKYRLLTHGMEEEILDKILGMSDSDSGKDYDSVWDIIKLMMSKQTVSVNGNNDADYITSYINKMEMEELAAYMSFVTHNTPRVNIDIRIGDSFFYDIK